MLIGDSWLPAEGGQSYTSENAYSDDGWAAVPDAGAPDVARAVCCPRRAGRPMGGDDRLSACGADAALAVLLTRDVRELADIETRDNGKLLRETRGQAEYLPAWVDYFAGVADKLQGEVIPSDRINFMVYTRHEPVGVVGAITPWNSPLLLLMWKLAPA